MAEKEKGKTPEQEKKTEKETGKAVKAGAKAEEKEKIAKPEENADAKAETVQAKKEKIAGKKHFTPKPVAKPFEKKAFTAKKPFEKKDFAEKKEFTPKPVEEKKKEKPKDELVLPDVLIFGKWSPKEVKVRDLGLSRYLNLDSKMVPHTFGKTAKKRFEKGKVSIVERMINKLMRSGQGKRKMSGKYVRGRHGCGKKLLVMRIVEDAFTIVEKETKENPIQVLVKAIENSAPREDTTRIKRGGISYTQAVDVSPLRRIDDSLKNIATAAFTQSFNTKTNAAQTLAKELILAAKGDHTSFAVKRRDEVERIAKSSR